MTARPSPDPARPAPHPHGPTWDGVRVGVVQSLPLAPGVFFFGAAFGALAAQKGMTLAEAVLMSGLVYAGASQFAAMEAWTNHWTLGGFIAIAAVVGVVNLRLFLMSAALRPWLQGLPPAFVYGQFTVFTDANYVVASRYRAEGGMDAGMLAGSGFLLWAIWVASTAPGYVVGALVSDPARFGFDLVMPIMFAAMIAPLWKSHEDTRNWSIAGAAALIVMHLVPGQWHIMAGAVAGMLAAAFISGDRSA